MSRPDSNSAGTSRVHHLALDARADAIEALVRYGALRSAAQANHDADRDGFNDAAPRIELRFALERTETPWTAHVACSTPHGDDDLVIGSEPAESPELAIRSLATALREVRTKAVAR